MDHTLSLIEIIIRVLLSFFLSAIIGFERELRSKGAGLRTHVLVCVGSTLIALTSIHLFAIYNSTTTNIDPTRMLAGIVQGVGFLCGGTIIRAGSQIKGLTTAASLWIASGIGIAVGCGCYFEAITVTIVVFFVLIWVHAIEKSLANKIKNLTTDTADD